MDELSKAQLRQHLKTIQSRPWWPQEGQQLEGFMSEADVMLYGGSAGGGKTDLLVGLALTEHLKTIIFRREATQLTGVVDRLTELVGSRDGYNSIEKIWRLPDRQIEFGSTPHAGDEQRFQGRPHDLIGFDELVHFNELQFRFLTGWLRSTTPGQRCRIVATSNPPTDSSGSWVIKYWAPWLDSNHQNPAESGELRWFVVSNGLDVEVPDNKPIEMAGEVLLPQSRTFIKSSVYDNAYLRDTGYLSTLMALPEPLRSQMLLGDFSAASFDSEWQVCPSADVKAAQDRWEPKTDEERLGMSAVGVDPARGGRDKTIIATRYGWWYDELIEMDVVSGGDIAAKVLKVSGQSCPVHVDVVGVGASTYDHLEPYLAGGVTAIQSAGAPMDEYDLSGQLGFANRRSELWWKFRELLSSDQPANIALPKDPDLFIELTAPRYRLTSRGIMIESKELIKKRIGRSTDKADAVIYASIRSPHLFDFDAVKRFRIKQALG